MDSSIGREGERGVEEQEKEECERKEVGLVMVDLCNVWRQRENEEDQSGQGYDLGCCCLDNKRGSVRGLAFRSGWIERERHMRDAINTLTIRRTLILGIAKDIYCLIFVSIWFGFFFFFFTLISLCIFVSFSCLGNQSFSL